MDSATANLPTRDMDATARFYEALGFTITRKKEGWMILNRGSIQLEFFPLPEHDPRESCFSACLRVDDLDGLHAEFSKVGLPNYCGAMPSMGTIEVEPYGIRLFTLIDPEGSLLRCIDNKFKA